MELLKKFTKIDDFQDEEEVLYKAELADGVCLMTITELSENKYNTQTCIVLEPLEKCERFLKFLSENSVKIDNWISIMEDKGFNISVML